MGAGFCHGCLPPVQLHSKDLGKKAEDSSSSWAPILHREAMLGGSSCLDQLAASCMGEDEEHGSAGLAGGK